MNTCPDCRHLAHWETCSETCRCQTRAPEPVTLPPSVRITGDDVPEPWGGD